MTFMSPKYHFIFERNTHPTLTTTFTRVIPNVNAVLTVKMATTLFLCDDALHSIFITQK